MCHPKNSVFSWIENLIIYWKLPWHQKVDSKPENFTYMVNFSACDKNVTKPPLIFESVQQSNGFMEWKWRHCIDVESRKVQ